MVKFSSTCLVIGSGRQTCMFACLGEKTLIDIPFTVLTSMFLHFKLDLVAGRDLVGWGCV